MKKNKLLSILDNIDMKTYIDQNMTAYKIVQQISPELGKNNTPSETAITSYIKNHFNLKWNTKTKTWISYQSNEDSNTICNKKSSIKASDNITVYHESSIIEDDSIEKVEKEAVCNETNNDLHNDENYTKKSIPSQPPSSTKNEDKSNAISNTNNITINKQYEKSTEKKTISKLNSNNSLNDELIDPSEYAEYITALGTEKFSLSISCFIIELIEQRISKKYNMKRQGNRSKIVQLALLEYLRLTK